MRAAPAIAAVLAAFGIDGPAFRYGRVVLKGQGTVPPAVFDHSSHRARFTCRLCHVDVGFAMTAGGTGITEGTILRGFHCAACHNGATRFAGKPIFRACATGPTSGEVCKRCHGGDDEARERDYAAMKLPRGRFHEIEWQRSEEAGLVKPVDTIEGVSVPRPRLKMDREITIDSRGSWMTDVIFSHKKHAGWHGCEVCHPEIYPATRAGAVKFTMFQIVEGQSCGACHGKVAFALAYCDRCHSKPVRFP